MRRNRAKLSDNPDHNNNTHDDGHGGGIKVSSWLTTRKQVLMVSAGALLCLFAAPAGVLAGTPTLKLAPIPAPVQSAPINTNGNNNGNPYDCGYGKSDAFKEDNVALAIEVIGSGSTAQIAAFGQDEASILLGKMGPTAGSTGVIGNGSLSNPSLGSPAANSYGRAYSPTIFVTDVTTNPTSTAGDWQNDPTNGSNHLDSISGSWSTFTGTTGNDQVTRPTNHNKNNPGTVDPLPGGAQPNEDFVTEAKWNASGLTDNNGKTLQAGHLYRFQVILHDGDHGYTGDVGELCTKLTIPGAPTPTFTTTKSVSPTGAVSVGQDLTYTLTETNTSATAGLPGPIVDTITTVGGATYTVKTAPSTLSGVITGANPTYTWTPASIPGGGSVTLSLVLHVVSAGAGPNSAINNNAVSGPGCPAPPTNAPPCGTSNPMKSFTTVKSVSPQGPVPVGTDLTYTITETNTGSVDADPGAILDHITTTGGATYAVKSGPTSAAGAVSGTNPDYTWNPGTIVAGHNVTLSMVLTVTGAGTAGSNPAVNNTAVGPGCPVSSPLSTVPPCGTSNPITSYAMTKTVDEQGAQTVGTVLHYHVTIHNLSPSVAGNPGTVTDTISTVGGATYTISGTTTSQGNVTLNNPTISWVVGNLAGGGSATLNLNLTITSAGNPPAANAAIDNTAVDVNTNCDVANTPACTTHTPVIAPHLVLNKTVDQTSLPSLPGNVLYTITLSNNGTAPATNVLVDDVLGGDAGFKVDLTSFKGSPVVTITTIDTLISHFQWTYATVNPGDIDTVQFSVQMLPPAGTAPGASGTATLTNTVSVPAYCVPGAGACTPTNYNNPGNNPPPVTVVTVAPFTCAATGCVQGITDTPPTGVNLNIQLAGFLFLGGLGLILVGVLARKPETRKA